jgi:hypothetical protein
MEACVRWKSPAVQIFKIPKYSIFYFHCISYINVNVKFTSGNLRVFKFRKYFHFVKTFLSLFLLGWILQINICILTRCMLLRVYILTVWPRVMMVVPIRNKHALVLDIRTYV